MLRSWVAAAALLIVLPALASAQAQTGRWSLTLHGGPVITPEASALETGATLGLDVLYHFTPRLSVGPTVGYIYTETDGRFFVAAVPLGGDSSRVYQVGQQVSVLTYSAAARFEVMPNARIAPYVSAGFGGYSIYLDAQRHNEPKRVSGPMLQLGGGLGYALSETVGISLNATDFVFMDYDREEMNPIRPELRNCAPENNLCFPGANFNDAPEAKDISHNIRVSLGFSYIPGLNR